MTHLIKMLLALALIIFIFLAQGCITINVNIDQGKSLITAPVEYEEDEELVTPVKNTFTKGVSI